MIDEEARFKSPPSKGGAALMTDKPTTNVIAMGTQAAFEPVSPMSGGSTPTPVKHMFSPRPDGTQRAVREQRNVDLQPELWSYEEEKHTTRPITDVNQAAIMI